MIGLVLAQPPDPPVIVTFENHTPAAVDIFWVDFDGVEQNYGLLEPGWVWEQETFAGHLWRFRQNGQLLGAYAAGRDAQQSYIIALEMERSLSGDTPVAVVFQNNTPAAVEVFWVDYEGAEQGYGEIPPGQNMQMETAATHLSAPIPPGAIPSKPTPSPWERRGGWALPIFRTTPRIPASSLLPKDLPCPTSPCRYGAKRKFMTSTNPKP